MYIYKRERERKKIRSDVQNPKMNAYIQEIFFRKDSSARHNERKNKEVDRKRGGKTILCQVHICPGRRVINDSTIFHTIFRHRKWLREFAYATHCVQASCDFF